ncbi:MAG: phosphatidylglycerophosphatase A [Rhodobacteraceae bacterium]|nr:phosphatidylglycerophosphatase A [Paracoccaceae bacterium]
MIRLLASFLGAGFLQPGPGTWGSLAALPVAWALHTLGGFPALATAVGLVLALGWWATGQVLRTDPDPDPAWIVIDEVAGMWIALLPVSAGAAHAGVPVLALWPGWVVAFLAFRLFDIWKPGPVGWADRRGGAFGVMLDDVIAGLLAALAVIAGAAIAHGVPAA